jgi:acyl-coenzyme A thioesterase PaaI-like protein
MPEHEQLEQRRRLAAATRRIIDGLVSTSASAADLAVLAEQVETAAATLAEHRLTREYTVAEGSLIPDKDAFLEASPISGPSNPVAAPIDVAIEDDAVRGTAVFGHAYEGPPGCLHGGFIAAVYDEILGMANAIEGSPGMTGTLEIVYRRPTPLHRELRFEATLDRVEGRKRYCSARMWAGETLCTEATGIFVSVNVQRFNELLDARDNPSG